MRSHRFESTYLIRVGYILELSRRLDVPLGPDDRLIYRDPWRGYVVIARAPRQAGG